MSDIILKLKTLLLYRGPFRGWLHDVWRVDPNSRICCSGDDCGCQGVIHRSFWQWMWDHRHEQT